MANDKLKHGAVLFFVLAAVLTVTTVMAAQFNHSGHVEGEKEQFLIGVSHPNLSEPRQIVMHNEIKKETAKHETLRVIFTDAAQSSEKQMKDVDKLLKFGIDLLIISLNDSDTLTPVVARAYEEIPVIVLGRGVTGYDYTLFIGPDNDSIGRKAGQLATDILQSKGGEIIEIRGPVGSPSVKDTSWGFREIIDRQKNINIVKTLTVNWQRDEAEDEVTNILPDYPDVDLIFAHSDAMALGAYRAVAKTGKKPIHILGIDGLNTEDGGIELVKDGEITGTFTFPTGGKEAIQYALDILNGVDGIPKKTILRSHPITADNVDNYTTAGSVNHHVRQVDDSKEKIVLGFAQVGTESGWRLANTESVISAARDAGIKLIYENAQGSQKKQIKIIRDFIKQDVDVIVFSPKVATGWEDVLEEAKMAGIPVILSDRQVKVEDDSLWTAFIGSDFVEEGRRAARWMIENTKRTNEEINIVELQGTNGAAPATGRRTGFREVLKEHPHYRIISSPIGNFTFDSGKQMMRDVLRSFGEEIDVVYAHNDDMALGAIQSIEEYGLQSGKDIKIISVDATSEAFKAMAIGKLNAAVECNPLLGPQLMKAVKDLTAGKEIPINIIMEEGVFTQKTAKQELPNRKY